MSDNFIIGGQTRLQCESPLSLSLSLARHSGRLPFGSNRGSCQHHPKQLVVCQTCYTAPRNRNPVLTHPNNKRGREGWREGGGGININIRAMAVLTPSPPSLSSPPALRLKERRRLNRGGRKDQRNGDGDEEEEDEAGEGVGGWMRHLAQSAQ